MTNKTVKAFVSIAEASPLAKGEHAPDFEPVQNFLQRFGYLRPGSFRGNRLDDETTEALTHYQDRQGLVRTGAFDKQTRDQMTTHRCGMPDFDSGVAFSTRCSWPHPNLTYAFEDGTNDVAGASEFEAVRNAFATWAEAAPLTFTELTTSQNPDIVIDWRPANDPDHSMVGGVLAHADFPPGCGVVTNTLPLPVHFDDQEHQWVIGAVANGFDVETVALHEIGHILGLQHSDVAGSVMFPSVSSNSTKRTLTADDIAGIDQLYPTNQLASGTYTIRQKSSSRFVDAHEIADKDFSVVTRTPQNNDTQRWTLASVGAVYTIRQKSNGRFLDAHDAAGNDFRLVTRPDQNNNTQRWVVLPTPDGSSTIQQLSNARFVDAHEVVAQDFSVVTRTAQNNDTQRWILTAAGANTFTIRQKSSSRFVDAHEIADNDFSVVTRTAQSNDTQRWIFGQVGAVYTIAQKGNGRFVDAHETSDKDFRVVTRTAQHNDTQRWVLLPAGGGSFTIQQLSSVRYTDAHESAGKDFAVVTRAAQNNDTQRWLIVSS